MGTGHPLVLIHGFGCDWTLAQNIPVLAAGGYRVFALDLLGLAVQISHHLITHWSCGGTTRISGRHTFRNLLYLSIRLALLSLMVVADYPQIATGGVLITAPVV